MAGLALIEAGCGTVSQAAKIERAWSREGFTIGCERAGQLAVAGERSRLYSCRITRTRTDGYGLSERRCAVWVDGDAYDVTRQARAAFASESRKPC